MSFAPVIPSGGLLGWNFLTRTQDAQKDVLEQSSQYKREAEYFRDTIAQVKIADDLVSDPILLRMSLSAFGLSDDAGNKYFIKKVLEDGVTDPDALDNRLADKRYLKFSESFGFGPGDIPRTSFHGFAETILGRGLEQTFQRSVGEQDPDLRLALGLASGLADIVGNGTSERARWFTILGTPPVRSVFEAALSLPSGIGAQDIDQQLKVFQERASAVLGTDRVDDFLEPDFREDLVRKFLLQKSIANTGFASSASNALTLLRGIA